MTCPECEGRQEKPIKVSINEDERETVTTTETCGTCIGIGSVPDTP